MASGTPRNNPEILEGMDPRVVAILRAMRWRESNTTSYEDGEKIREDVVGGSGERGRFQFMPQTWETYQNMYLAPEERIPHEQLNDPASREIEHKVMYKHIEGQVMQGFPPEKIFVSHNAGPGRWNEQWDEAFAAGEKPWVAWQKAAERQEGGAVNEHGAAYDLIDYVDKSMLHLGEEEEIMGGDIQYQDPSVSSASPEQRAFDVFRRNPKNLDHFVGATRGN